MFEIPAGWLGDTLGARKVMTRIALFWVAFTALTGTAWNLTALVGARFLFGIGEAGAFPNIARAAREWFPFRERGVAQGWVWLSARWGGAIAPLLMMLAAHPAGWRVGFVLLSTIGALWLWGFRRGFADAPAQHPDVSAAEAALIAEASEKKPDAPHEPLSWATMLRSPTLWFLSAMYFGSNAGWSFFASWITPYLRQDLGMTGVVLVLASGGPLFAGGIACFLGGRLTDRQVRLWGRRWGRTLQGVLGYGIGGALLLVAVNLPREKYALAYAAICLSSFIKDFGMAASWATTIDIGQRYSGTVAGVMNTLGNLAQVISVPLVARLAIWAGTAAKPNWHVSLYYYAAMFFIAAVCWVFVDPRKVIVYRRAQA